MSGQTVCTWECNSGLLRTGSIVVSGGRARYLGEKLRTRLGYDEWAYTTYGRDGEARTGQMSIRVGSLVTVVAVTTDGALVTP